MRENENCASKHRFLSGGRTLRGGRLARWTGQPRGPPVPATEEHRDGGYQQRADEERVQEDRERDGEAELAGLLRVARDRQDREGTGKDEAGGGDGAAGVPHGKRQGVVQRVAARLLA